MATSSKSPTPDVPPPALNYFIVLMGAARAIAGIIKDEDDNMSWGSESSDELSEQHLEALRRATIDLEEHNGCTWEEPGLLHRWFESSHLPDCKPQRYDHGLQVDYECCKPHELKRFVNDRGLQDPYPAGVTLKYYYIPMLQAADRKEKFPRFMDLPAEMRLEVYRYLLILPGGDPEMNNCYTAVLRSCRQVYKEAKDVLYGENVIGCEFGVIKLLRHWDYEQRARVHNSIYESSPPANTSAQFFSFPDGVDHYPEFLRKIHRLEVHVFYVVEQDYGQQMPSATTCLNNVLCTFASFLMDGHSLKELTFILHISDQVPVSHVERIFYPLRRLRNVNTVRIAGCFDMPAHIEETLLQEMTSPEPVFNTLRHWKLLDKETAAHFAVMESTNLELCLYPDCEKCPHHELEHLLARIEDQGEDFAMGSNHEELFIATLSRLRNKLSGFDTKTLLSSVKTLATSRQLRKHYEATADEGRFEEAEGIWRDKFSLNPDEELESDWPKSDDVFLEDEDHSEVSQVHADPSSVVTADLVLDSVTDSDVGSDLSSDSETTGHPAGLAATRSTDGRLSARRSPEL